MPFPNEDTQFKPGESGNPAGRPKGARSMKTIIRDLIAIEQTVKVKNKENGQESYETREVAEWIVLAQIQRAMKGDTIAFRELMDRLEGRPNQAVSVGFEDGNITAIEVKVLTNPGDWERYKEAKELERKAIEELDSKKQ